MQELKYFLRLVKGDVRIGMGPANILPALHKGAYDQFKAACAWHTDSLHP